MKQDRIELSGRECLLFACDKPAYILIQTLGRHEREGIVSLNEMIVSRCQVPFVASAFQVFDWSEDLMPWSDPAISRDPKVGQAAGTTLQFITDNLLPHLRALYGDLPVIIGGYSLGGLFALWASMQVDLFSAVAAASPSLWIRNWPEYSSSRPVLTGKVYLSLGDREEHVKNKSIAQVGDRVRGEYELLRSCLGEGNCILEWNAGGHFQDCESRLADAYCWCLNSLNNA
ncbi:MAG: hypothetical protein IJ205_06285 [Bacteroidales bacterium]|nr:hypothetical protein [Bacteroidales bacterium]